MDQQELKMMFDLIASMTEASKEAFIWWLIISKGTMSLVLFTLVAGAYKVLMAWVDSFREERTLSEISALCGYADFYSNDLNRRRLVDLVRDRCNRGK